MLDSDEDPRYNNWGSRCSTVTKIPDTTNCSNSTKTRRSMWFMKLGHATISITLEHVAHAARASKDMGLDTRLNKSPLASEINERETLNYSPRQALCCN